MSAEPSVLRDVAFMDALLDLLIPPGDDGHMPGAGSLDLSDELADAVEADARFGPAITSALQAIRDAARARDPGGLAALPAAARLEVIETELAQQPALIRGLDDAALSRLLPAPGGASGARGTAAPAVSGRLRR